MRFAVAVFVAVLLAIPAGAAITGNMSATMAQGEHRTFTIENDYPNGRTGPMTIAVNADRGLLLGPISVTGNPTAFTCTQSARANICRGTAGLTAGQKLTITQEVIASADAFGTLLWALSVISDGLSGLNPAKGTITMSNPRPKVVVTRFPEGVVTAPGIFGDDSFSIKNVGNAPTTVTITPPANLNDPVVRFRFFATTVSLQPGQEEPVLYQFGSQQSGYFSGTAALTGDGVPPDTTLGLRGASIVGTPTFLPVVAPVANRVESSVDAGATNATVDVPFTNSGSGEAVGLAVSNVSWLQPAAEIVRIAPGETKNIPATIDVARQAAILEGSGGSGSLSGTVTLRYLVPTTPSGRVQITADGLPTASSSTTVVSTISINLATATLPPIPDVHDALFIPGLGHVRGSVGLFISDLSIYPQVERGLDALRTRALADVDLYFTPAGSSTTRKVSVATLAMPDVATFGDVVGTVYKENAVGSLQVRTPGYLAGQRAVGVNANVFNVSDPKGTLGTSIPVFKYGKSNCAQEILKRIYLTGLRKDSSGHTNFYIQETCGAASSVRLTFLDAAGNSMSTTNADLGPFAVTQISSAAMPEGAVSAVLQHNAGSAGGFVAYATPVDRASGDTWAQVDWPNLFNYSPIVQVLIPVAGATAGANNTYFRTDLSIMNVYTDPGVATLRYYNRSGDVIERTINLAPMHTVSYSDVTTTLFGVTGSNVGYLMFLPTSGRFLLTSRNYSTPANSNATFGTAVPTVAFDYALRAGASSRAIRRIGGIDDVSGTRGATFRSNMGLIETFGSPVTVKVTIFYRSVGTLTSTVLGGSATFELAPRQFMLTNLATAVFGANRAAVGDLRNALVEFEVIGGTGGVLPFISAIDNGTGDSTFRID